MQTICKQIIHKAREWATLPQTLKESIDTCARAEPILAQLRRLLTRQEIARTLSEPKYNDPLRLELYGHKCYSQNDEDGIIQEIFRRIGTTNRIFVEFGVGEGLENNSLFLLKQGWKGLWIDGSPQNAAAINTGFADPIARNQLCFKESFITKDNINELIGGYFTGEIDMLSVDIDGNDYYVWQAIDVVSPRGAVTTCASSCVLGVIQSAVA